TGQAQPVAPAAPGKPGPTTSAPPRRPGGKPAVGQQEVAALGGLVGGHGAPGRTASGLPAAPPHGTGPRAAAAAASPAGPPGGRAPGGGGGRTGGAPGGGRWRSTPRTTSGIN